MTFKWELVLTSGGKITLEVNNAQLSGNGEAVTGDKRFVARSH